ncbi:calcium-binding protein [Mesorhizobium sp. LHD-90]|uniref:calcium-binding protein n=1 Tax=Mesorhizobium sp. LHD-90 TaxID=3071414 RepID=UPI0027E08436|nr:calcium-binding protein [Mesorhizobium sp. LHD-90]MDQ6435649.1 calcium-binding protein [Mesorhizobium sp. LHD-90]
MATFTGTNDAEILPSLLLGPVQATGNDFVDALGGNDIAIGWSGDDVVRGGSGADVIIGGLLNVAGVITASGDDTADYTNSAAGVTIDLSTIVNLVLPILGLNVQLTGASQGFGGDAQGDYLVGINNLRGSNTHDTLTGSANAANTLEGQGGNDILHDGGVGVADTLIGGDGNDTYLVYNTGDVVIESASGGTDRVSAGVDYKLGIGANVELLNTTSLRATYAMNLTGNEIAQSIRGNDGANVIDGGRGNDMLYGMGGQDTFRFSTALGTGNVDRIVDFRVVDDQIELDGAIFTTLDLGALDAARFKDNASAPRDADDRIIYNSDTGSLFYDADGVGGTAAVKIATLTPGLGLSAADFTVI